MSNSPAHKIVDMNEKRIEQAPDNVWLDVKDDWMFDDIADTAPMAVEGLVPENEFSSICGAAKSGKSVAAWDLAQKIAWHQEGDTWLGGKVNIDGPVLFMSKEESRRTMTLMSKRMKSVERRLTWESKNGKQQRIFMKDRGQAGRLIEADKTGVYETKLFTQTRQFMMDLKPALSFFETLSKTLLIELTDRGQMSVAMDILSSLSYDTKCTAMIGHHVNKLESGTAVVKTNEGFRNAISGSAAFIEGLRNHVGIRRAHEDLGLFVVAKGYAENRFQVFCVSTIGNYDECAELEMLPRVMVRGHYSEGWKDVTKTLLAECREEFDTLRSGGKPGKAK